MSKKSYRYPLRLRAADWLCRIACWLRGERWYVANVFHGVPGNRAAELQSRIWQNAVLLSALREDKEDELNQIERDLAELSQMSGAAWGHVWPKEEKVVRQFPEVRS